jgi:hypothetical protein
MPLETSADPTLGTGAAVGKYFSVVSVIPSVLLTSWVYLLLAAGALNQAPSIATLKSNNPVEHPGYLATALAFAVAIALIGHPLQSVLVQVLEGYWGDSALARNLRVSFILSHLRRIERARQRRVEGTRLRKSLAPSVSGDLNEYLHASGMLENPDAARIVVYSQAQLDAWEIVEAQYPDDRTAMLPTRLGNILRRHELRAGAAIHLPILDWATHIGMVADEAHTTYVNDQRTQLDLAVRMAASAFLAAVVTLILLWPYGWSSLLALVPYAAAVLSYRGAVVSADSYGRALRAWVDLNRTRLYSELDLPPVRTASEEREQNDRLVGLIFGQDSFESPLRQTDEG